MREPGLEPGSLAWKARILAIELLTRKLKRKISIYKTNEKKKN